MMNEATVFGGMVAGALLVGNIMIDEIDAIETNLPCVLPGYCDDTTRGLPLGSSPKNLLT